MSMMKAEQELNRRLLHITGNSINPGDAAVRPVYMYQTGWRVLTKTGIRSLMSCPALMAMGNQEAITCSGGAENGTSLIMLLPMVKGAFIGEVKGEQYGSDRISI